MENYKISKLLNDSTIKICNKKRVIVNDSSGDHKLVSDICCSILNHVQVVF